MINCLGRLAIGFACFVAPLSVNAQASDSEEVLARELYFEERGDKRRALWTADPMLAQHPVIFRALRAESLQKVRLPAECDGEQTCVREIRDERIHAGQRLLSTFKTTDEFLGGAHGSVSVADGLYDLKTNRRIRFGNLFTSWKSAKPLIQAKVCESLLRLRKGSECPDADELAYGLRELDEVPLGGPANAFEIRMSDYALGSYAAGRETLLVWIDRGLYELIKPEYRADFRVQD